jgi:hypothetical protein
LTKIEVNPDDIVFDMTVYPRSHVDWHTVQTYQQAILAGAKLPAPVVTKLDDKLILVDGGHTVTALKILGRSLINVEQIVCKGYAEAFEESIRRNISHGKQLTFSEKLVLIPRLQKHGKSDKYIAKLLQVEMKKVRQWSKERLIQTPEGPVALKPPLKHLDETSNLNAEDQKIFSASSQITIVTQLIIIIKRGWLTNDPKLQDALIELKTLLKKLPIETTAHAR